MKATTQVLVLLVLLSACSDKSVAPPATPRHGIITMAPNLTETVFALGQGSRVIAVGSFDDYPPEISTLPKVGGYLDPDLEKIAVLNPELIIVPGKDRNVADFASMKGIPVLNVNMDSLETIDAGIETIGKALNCVAAADKLRAHVKGEIDAVRAAVKGLPRPKVLIITMRQDHNLNHLYTANHASFVSQIVECAGGDNLYADAPATYPEASKETVVMKAPDVILEFHAGEKLDDAEKARYVADWQQLPSLPAVQHERIYLVTESYAVRPGPRVGEVTRIVATMLHPDLSMSFIPSIPSIDRQAPL